MRVIFFVEFISLLILPYSQNKHILYKHCNISLFMNSNSCKIMIMNYKFSKMFWEYWSLQGLSTMFSSGVLIMGIFLHNIKIYIFNFLYFIHYLSLKRIISCGSAQHCGQWADWDYFTKGFFCFILIKMHYIDQY